MLKLAFVIRPILLQKGKHYEVKNLQAFVVLECILPCGTRCMPFYFRLVNRVKRDRNTMNIELKNLTLAYAKHPVVHHLTVTIKTGDLLAIVGPNGAGKSTLLNALAGLTTIDQGSIEGINPDDVAYLPQQTKIDRSFPLTVVELVATGFWQNIGFHRSIGNKELNQCEEAIAAVGLQGFEKRMINTLSGGQMQRVLFARVLLQDKQIILLDEPFNAIDSKTIADLTKVISSWHHDQRTVVMVSHDLEYVRKSCPKTLLIARESVGFGQTKNVLTTENINRAQQMCEAFDDSADWCKREVA